MADRSMEHDKQVLHRMGYAQELARRMSLFSNFAISFSIICILAGGISSFAAAFNSTGGGGAFVGWFIGGIFSLLVSFSMGQIASAYPTAGGLYHWGSILGGKFWGWLTAWFNLLGLIFVVSSVDVYLYLVFFKGLLLETVLHVDTTSFTIIHQHVFVVLCLITQALLNHYGINLTTKLTDLSGYLIFALTIVLVIALFAYSPVPLANLDFSRLFSFTNYTGDAGGGVVPATSSLFLAFFFGLIYVMYTITGFDASGHTSEETHDAQVNVPKGMWTSVFYSWTFGLIMVAAFILTMPNLDEGAATGGNSFVYALSGVLSGTSGFHYIVSLVLGVGLVVVNYICALAGLTSMSRMMFAFSRDGGLPFSHFLSHISTATRTPTYAIWTGIVLAFLSTLYSDVFLLLATGCAVFLYLSYMIPVIAGFFAEGNTWKEKGPFNLGSWSKPNAIIAAIGVALLTITGFVPPFERIFYLTVGMVVGLLALWSKRTAVISVIGSILIYIGSKVGVLSYIAPSWALAFVVIAVVIGAIVWFWYGGESERFQGVPQGEKIMERQKMIAEVEKKYGEAD